VNLYQRGIPDNKLWKIYGSVAGQATLTVTLPFVQPRTATLETIAARCGSVRGGYFHEPEIGMVVGRAHNRHGNEGHQQEVRLPGLGGRQPVRGRRNVTGESQEFYWQ